MENHALVASPDAKPGDPADASVEVIEPRQKLTKKLVRHLGLQGEVQALSVWLRFSHAEKSTVELSILEAACQHMC